MPRLINVQQPIIAQKKDFLVEIKLEKALLAVVGPEVGILEEQHKHGNRKELSKRPNGRYDFLIKVEAKGKQMKLPCSTAFEYCTKRCPGKMLAKKIAIQNVVIEGDKLLAKVAVNCSAPHFNRKAEAIYLKFYLRSNNPVDGVEIFLGEKKSCDSSQSRDKKKFASHSQKDQFDFDCSRRWCA